MSDNQVEEIKGKIDIATVIGERIDIKKAGRNFKANCPFHGEKTPSFMISAELQIYKCFGCGESGDVFTFLEKYEGMDFPEALKYLAEKTGVKLQKTNFKDASEKEKLIEINAQAVKFYHYMLTTHALGKKALDYLLGERGLSPDTIKEFQIGYSPENSYIISKFLIEKKKFNSKDVEKSGLGIAKGENVYDRFNGRVIFPLMDHRGNTIGFAGRLLPWDKRETGKYINSPETILYRKSSVLFGLNLTRSFIKKKKVAIIVEGELDAISSYQAGIKNVVAIKGSALTEDHVKLLSRFAEKFILCLDADSAGDAASRRGLTVAQNAGTEIRVATLSKHKDPDEAAKKDLETFKRDLIGAKNVWDFLIGSIVTKHDLQSGEGKAKISRELTPILSSIEDKIVQAHYTNLVAKRLEVPVEAVFNQISKVNPPEKTAAPLSLSGIKKAENESRQNMLEARLLSLAFNFDPEMLLNQDIKDLIEVSVHKKIISYIKRGEKFNIQKFGKSLPGELFDKFTQIVLSGEENKKELDLVKKELKILLVKEKLKNLTLMMRGFEENDEKDELLNAQNQFNSLVKKLSSLNSALVAE